MTIAASPCRVDHGARDEGDAGLVAKRVRERLDLALRRRIRQLGGDDERAVRAGAESLRVEVVGLAGHRVGRVVSGVGEAEPHAEGRGREREQYRGRDDHRHPGMALDHVAPARRGRLADAVGRQVAAEERDPQAVDLGAEEGEDRRQQRDGGEHHDQNRERGRDRHPVHVVEPGQAEAEDGDHDGAAGDDHAAPRGRDRLDDGVVAVLSVRERRAEAGQDEQRVVDPDPDPDQSRDGCRPVGDVDDVREQCDQAPRRDAEADESDQRAAGRRRRASRRRSGARSRRRGSRGPRGSTAPGRHRSDPRRA